VLRAEPDGELDQPVIKERNARFDTVRHAAAILPMHQQGHVGMSHGDAHVANLPDYPQNAISAEPANVGDRRVV
jgi:hypothetical protein